MSTDTMPAQYDAIMVREAREGDLPAIVAMLADDPLGRTRERAETPLPGAYGEAFAAIQAQAGNCVLVAESQARILGCLQLMILPGLSHMGMTRAEIEGVRVASDQRGRGLGAVLLGAAIERARAAGCGLVQLTTNAAREDARRFYERLGFTASHVGMKLDLR